MEDYSFEDLSYRGPADFPEHFAIAADVGEEDDGMIQTTILERIAR